jgi:putative transposase
LVTGEDLIDELDRLAEQRSYPAVLLRPRPRARPHAMADWPANASGCPIPPGRAVPQRLLESFNSRIRDESSTSTSSGHGPTPAS